MRILYSGISRCGESIFLQAAHAVTWIYILLASPPYSTLLYSALAVDADPGRARTIFHFLDSSNWMGRWPNSCQCNYDLGLFIWNYRREEFSLLSLKLAEYDLEDAEGEHGRIAEV